MVAEGLVRNKLIPSRLGLFQKTRYGMIQPKSNLPFFFGQDDRRWSYGIPQRLPVEIADHANDALGFIHYRTDRLISQAQDPDGSLIQNDPGCVGSKIF